MSIELTDFLKHYGVPGMKWRKRKGGGAGKSGDHSAAKKLRKKPLSEMNNDEIKQLATRLQLEKQYKDLTPSKVTAGQKKVAIILAAGATINGVIALSKSPAGQAAKKVITTALMATSDSGRHSPLAEVIAVGKHVK